MNAVNPAQPANVQTTLPPTPFPVRKSQTRTEPLPTHKVTKYTHTYTQAAPRAAPRSVRVEVRPHVLYLSFQPRLRSLPCSLEGHVLEKVCHPVVLRRLVSTARIDPYPDRCRRPVARLPVRREMREVASWTGGVLVRAVL